MIDWLFGIVQSLFFFFYIFWGGYTYMEHREGSLGQEKYFLRFILQHQRNRPRIQKRLQGWLCSSICSHHRVKGLGYMSPKGEFPQPWNQEVGFVNLCVYISNA